MKVLLPVVVIGMLTWSCSKQDAIDRLVTRVDHEMELSYPFSPIRLPETASPEQCISNLAFRHELRGPKILETRLVHVQLQNSTAVRSKTDEGEKIVLLHPMGTNGWYFRIYECE